MKPQTIDDQIRQYYEAHRLSVATRERLKATLRSGADPHRDSPAPAKLEKGLLLVLADRTE
ncbi:MAG: hypothetical protein ACYC60_08465 [Thermoanaerobaculia bacterium]